MEKRLFLAIALSIVVVLAWNYMFPPPKPQPAQLPGETMPIAESEAPDTLEPREDGETTTPSDDPTVEEAVVASAEEEIRVVNEIAEVVWTNRGGTVLAWRLLDFTTPDGTPLELWPRFEGAHPRYLGFDLDDTVLADELNEALYEVERVTLNANDARGEGERLTFRWSDGRGLSAVKEFTFWQHDYLVEVRAEVIDRGRPKNVRLILGPGFSAQELRKGQSNYSYSNQLLFDSFGNVTRRKANKLEQDGGVSAPLTWAGLEDQYFTALIIPSSDRSQLTWRMLNLTRLPPPGVDGVEVEIEAAEEPVVSLSVNDGNALLYVGPKDYRLLRDLGHGLERAVWFSSYGWLAWIVRHIYLGLLWLHDNVTGNYGLAIVLATLLLRILLFPVNQYSMVAMKKSQLQMQHLQPKVKAIRAKYKKAKDAPSRQRMNQEMMDLYRDEGVNPMGGVTGCLPLLAQFPILIGFYNMLTVAVELRGAPFFGWIQDLSVRDPLWITPLLMGVTMFAQQKMAMTKIKDPQQLQQQRIMLFMPVMFTFICLQMPSGLVLYWFVNNVLGMGQQWLVNRHTEKLEASGALHPVAPVKGVKGKKRSTKGSA